MSQNRPNILIFSEDKSQIIIDEFNKFNNTINFYECINEVDIKAFLSDIKNSSLDLIILNLEKLSSSTKDLLRYIKTTSSIKYIPVVILSSSPDKNDIDYAYNNFANSYILKSEHNLKNISNIMAEFWLSTVILPSQH